MTKEGENNFHNKYDKINHTLSLIKIKSKSLTQDKKRIYGGYAEEIWDITKGVKSDPNAFIFSFTKRSKPMKSQNPSTSLICHQNFGPSFGAFIPEEKQNQSYPELWIRGRKGGYDYTTTFGDDNMICTGGIKAFEVLETEVYQIIFE